MGSRHKIKNHARYRILFVNRYFFPDHSATSQLLSDLAFYLADQSFQVTVITGRQRYDNPKVRLPAREMIRDVRIFRVWSSRFGRRRLIGRAVDYASFYFTATWRLFVLARKGDVIIAKTDPPLLGVFAALVARIKGARLVNWVQDMFPEVAQILGVKIAGGGMGVVLRRLRNYSLRAASANVVIGERMAKRLEREGVSAHSIRVIHNWADGKKINSVSNEENLLRAAWGLQGKFIVGYSGNMGRAHEFETILWAAEHFRENDDIRFLFIGDGKERNWIEDKIKERQLANVIMRPYQERESLSHSLSLPDVHLISLKLGLEDIIVPSKFYGIAAAARATIYIGAQEGEIPGILQRYQCGWSVAPGDVDGLVATIVRLQADPLLVKTSGQLARRVFEEKFDQRYAFAAWKNLLGDVTGVRDFRG